MTQIESEFIPYTPPLEFTFDWTYHPMRYTNERIIPARHPLLASLFKRIGGWFTEKGCEWDEHRFFIMPGSYKKNVTFGDYAFDSDQLLSTWRIGHDGSEQRTGPEDPPVG